MICRRLSRFDDLNVSITGDINTVMMTLLEPDGKWSYLLPKFDGHSLPITRRIKIYRKLLELVTITLQETEEEKTMNSSPLRVPVR